MKVVKKYTAEDLVRYRDRATRLGDKAIGYAAADADSDIEYDPVTYEPDNDPQAGVRSIMTANLGQIFQRLNKAISDSTKPLARREDKVNADPLNAPEVVENVEYIEACSQFLKAPNAIKVPRPPEWAWTKEDREAAEKEKVVKVKVVKKEVVKVKVVKKEVDAAAAPPARVFQFDQDRMGENDPLFQEVLDMTVQQAEDAQNEIYNQEAQFAANLARARAASLLDVNPRADMWGHYDARRGPVAGFYGGAAGEAELRAMPLQAAAAAQARAPVRVIVDPAKQLGFDQMVAKIKQIDIAVSKGQAARKKEYLKTCFKEVLDQVKGHEAELLGHNLDVPTCLRKSLFIQQCTGMREDSDNDLFAQAMLGLNEDVFDNIIP